MNPLEAPRRISFDLDTFSGVARKRWWIVPLTMLIGLALMFWQESDLQTEPRYFTLTRTFEALDEMAPLALVDLNPTFMQPVPSETSQLGILRTDEYIAKAKAGITTSMDLTVNKSETQFSLSTERDISEARRFTFTPATNSSYSFVCTETDEENCDKAITNYVGLLTELRKSSIESGLSRSLQLFDRLLEQSSTLSDEQIATLTLQKTAMEQSIALASGELKMTSESRYFGGEQISTVNRSTYLFGLLVGFIIGFLILLQLTVGDSVVRTPKKLVSLIGSKNFLGYIDRASNPNSLEIVGSAMMGKTRFDAETVLRIIPIGKNKDLSSIANELGRILGCRSTVTRPISSISADELKSDSTSPLVIFASQSETKIAELETTMLIAEKSGNAVIGVVLSKESGSTTK